MSGSNILKAVAERTTVTVDPDGELRTEVSFGGEAPVDLRVITEKGLDGDETLIVRSTVNPVKSFVSVEIGAQQSETFNPKTGFSAESTGAVLRISPNKPLSLAFIDINPVVQVELGTNQESFPSVRP